MAQVHGIFSLRVSESTAAFYPMLATCCPLPFSLAEVLGRHCLPELPTTYFPPNFCHVFSSSTYCFTPKFRIAHLCLGSATTCCPKLVETLRAISKMLTPIPSLIKLFIKTLAQSFSVVTENFCSLYVSLRVCILVMLYNRYNNPFFFFLTI